MMERYLLFDSGCSLCTELAQTIEQETNGWLTARSLRDLEVKVLLDQARPGWRWEPMLLELEPERTRAYNGLLMGLRMVTGLGPQKAWRVIQLVRSSGLWPGYVDPDRRRFLYQMTTLFGAITLLTLPESWQHREKRIEQYHTQGPDGGEMYQGFLLLPEGAPIPAFAKCTSMPIICGVGNQSPDPMYLGENAEFATPEELQQNVNFPLYTLATLPDGIQYISANVLRFAQSKHTFMANINFGSYGEVGTLIPLIQIWAQRDFTRPYPVYPVWISTDQGTLLVEPEKISITPSPGILLPSYSGHVVQWIEQGVLYTLVTEHDASREAAVAIVASLARV